MILNRPRRRAMAPLELALTLPILLSVVVAILYVARAGVAKTAALSDARGEVWAHRGDADPGPVGQLDHPLTTGLVEKRTGREIPIRLAAAPRTATAGAETTFGAWSFEHLALDSQGTATVLPYLQVLRLLLDPKAQATSRSVPDAR
jgi:hypothetical protein